MEYFIGLFWQTNWSTFWSLKANVICTSKIILRLNVRKRKKKMLWWKFHSTFIHIFVLGTGTKMAFPWWRHRQGLHFLESQGCMVHWTAKFTFFFRCHQVRVSHYRVVMFSSQVVALDMKEHSNMCPALQDYSNTCLALQSPVFGVDWKGSSLTTNP